MDGDTRGDLEKTEENLHEILGDIYSVSYVEWMKMFSDWRAERWNTLIR